MRCKLSEPAGSTKLVQMKSLVPQRRRTHGWLVAGLLLASCGWLAPSRSWAGCSQHVTTKWDAALSRTRDLDRLDWSGAQSPDWRRSAPIDPSPGPSCSGPRCSRNSSQPVTVPRALSRINAWCCLDLRVFVPRADSTPFPFDDDTPCPSDRVDPIARPPWC